MLARFLFVAVLLLLPAQQQPARDSSGAQTPQDKCSYWYPLAVNNHWVYRTTKSRPARTVTWHVTLASGDGDGHPIFQLVPSPTEADDDWFEVVVKPEGLQLNDAGFFLLKSPLRENQQWRHEFHSVRQNRTLTRSYRVLSRGKPCAAGNLRFRNCLVIEEVDEELSLRVLTTYAAHVGPVQYVHFKMTDGKIASEPEEALHLVSYRVK